MSRKVVFPPSLFLEQEERHFRGYDVMKIIETPFASNRRPIMRKCELFRMIFSRRFNRSRLHPVCIFGIIIEMPSRKFFEPAEWLQRFRCIECDNLTVMGTITLAENYLTNRKLQFFFSFVLISSFILVGNIDIKISVIIFLISVLYIR